MQTHNAYCYNTKIKYYRHLALGFLYVVCWYFLLLILYVLHVHDLIINKKLRNYRYRELRDLFFADKNAEQLTIDFKATAFDERISC